MNREDVVIITICGVTWDQEMKGDFCEMQKAKKGRKAWRCNLE